MWSGIMKKAADPMRLDAGHLVDLGTAWEEPGLGPNYIKPLIMLSMLDSLGAWHLDLRRRMNIHIDYRVYSADHESKY